MNSAKPEGLTETLRRLAARADGVRSNDPEVKTKWKPQAVTATLRRLNVIGEIHRAELSKTHVVFFTKTSDAEKAKLNHERNSFNNRFIQKVGNTPANWASIEPVITEKTKFTLCPSHLPTLSEVILPNIYATGNQRGRVQGAGDDA